MNPATILCLGTTPTAQHVMVFRKLALAAVNRAVTTLDGVGGKSLNVAKVLKALGEHPVAITFLGGARGEFIRAAMKESGIESDVITVRAPTRQCVTVIDESDGTHTELIEESRPVEAADFDRLMAVVRRRVVGCRAVVMSGTIASGGPTALYADCTRLAHEQKALPVVDAQGGAFDGVAPGQTGTRQTQPRRTRRHGRARTHGRGRRDAGHARLVRAWRATGGRDLRQRAGAGARWQELLAHPRAGDQGGQPSDIRR